MKDGMFIFDCVVHAVDTTDANLQADAPGAQRSRAISGGAHAPRPGSTHKLTDAPAFGRGSGPLLHRWSAEELYAMTFEHSSVDMAMAQTIPLFDWYKEGLSPVRANYEFAKAYPDKVLFCGGVDPSFHGGGVYDEMERQVTEWGACSFKFYNAHNKGNTWRCDDEKIAYPMYEKAFELGIDVIQFHKGFALGTNAVEDLRPNDLQQAALDFPHMQFVIYHLALPYFDECLSIASRFENVHLALAGNLTTLLTQPRLFQKQIGECMRQVGPDRLFWGSEIPATGNPDLWIELFLDFEMPADLQEGYGYPALTREDKRKILGENFARLMKVDISRYDTSSHQTAAA